MVSKKDVFVFLCTCASFLFFYTYLFICLHNRNATISKRVFNKNIANALYEYRWKVYTREPDTFEYHLYKIEPNVISEVEQHPFVSEYYWGLKRNYKIVAEEIIEILKDTSLTKASFSDSAFHVFKPQWDNILGSRKVSYVQVSSFNIRYVIGKYIIARVKAKKWGEKRAPIDNSYATFYPVNIYPYTK